jgi:hypothetical protein
MMTTMTTIRKKKGKWERTVRCPIASGDHTVYTLLRADLLAKRRDPGVRDESGVERIHAFPRCVSCMGAAKAPLSMSAAGTGGRGGWDGRTAVRNIPQRGSAVRGRTRILALACRLPRGDTWPRARLVMNRPGLPPHRTRCGARGERELL